MSTRTFDAIALAALFATQPAVAGIKHRERMVRLAKPYPAAGTTDVIGRLLANKLAQKFGTSFIVENRPGAGSIIGSDDVAKAPQTDILCSWDL